MHAVEVREVSKSFGAKRVVKDASFIVEMGEIFGILGPNGAGKTTTIRMMMDIIKPDSGEIRVLGESLGERSKARIGYLPEARGLYRRISVMETLTYFAALKGVNKRVAERRGLELLERVDMLANRRRKIEELSRGMQQKIQFLVTIVHDPDLIILDEPLSGFDPINTRLLKDIIWELKAQGKTILMSTHMMNQVEEMCDRIFLIDQGTPLLYGNLREIKRRFAENAVILECEGDLGQIEGVRRIERRDRHWELFLESGATPQELLRQLALRPDLEVNRFEVATPSLNDIFIEVVEGRR